MKYPWREASTVILTALKSQKLNLTRNYDVLVLQRSSESSFMPNGCVFPGGVADPADDDEGWLNLFSNFNLDWGNATKITGEIPPILGGDMDASNGCLPKLLSLKITAVRELFEETGILLCFGKHEKSTGPQKWASFCTFEGLNSWRVKVQENPKEFLNLCQKWGFCPDVNNLHLWSNWLTPTSLGKKRFDTAFFIACLVDTPVAAIDNKEIQKLNWYSPGKLMELCKEKKAWLPPPQVYEISRLLQFNDINDLHRFAQNRATEGCERWMPVQKKTLDALVSILPGDSAYKEVDDYTPTKPEEIKMSTKEFRNQSNVLHRMEFIDKLSTKIVVKNFTPKNGQVLPVVDDES